MPLQQGLCVIHRTQPDIAEGISFFAPSQGSCEPPSEDRIRFEIVANDGIESRTEDLVHKKTFKSMSVLSGAEAEVAQPGKAMDCYLIYAGQTSIVRKDSGVQIPPFALPFLTRFHFRYFNQRGNCTKPLQILSS